MDENSFYLNARARAIEWTTNFINSLPSITVDERDILINMTSDIHIDTIHNIGAKIFSMENVSQDKKNALSIYINNIKWIDWQAGEKSRVVRNMLWLRPPALDDILTPEELDNYYESQPPTAQAQYRLQQYLEQHPRKAKKMTDVEREELYLKFLEKVNKCKKEVKLTKNTMNNHNIPKIDSLKIENQYINNTRIARCLPVNAIALEPTETYAQSITVGNIINLIDIEANANIILSKYNITILDMAIMDAAYSIWKQANPVITAEWIAKVLSGNPKANPTPEKIEEVRNSIEKLSAIRVKIDCTDEYNERQKQKSSRKLSSLIYESYLLPIEKISAQYQANGKKITAYPLLKVPALYQYAEELNQIIKVPAELFETTKYFKDTEEAILIKRYVIKRVAQIINQKNKLASKKISFLWDEEIKNPNGFINKSNNNSLGNNKPHIIHRGLYPELGYNDYSSTKWRTKTKPMILKVVRGTLENLKQHGYIADYQEYRKNGGSNKNLPIMGFEITLSNKSIPSK